jgi:integrase
MATLRKRNGRWQAQVRRGGHGTSSRTFSSKADALAWASSEERKIEVGDIPRPDKTERSLGELLDRYEEEVIPLKRTDSGEGFMLRAFTNHPISKKQLKHLRAQDFAQLRDQMLQTSRPSTVVRKLSVLRHALSVAHDEWDWHSPIGEIGKVRFPTVTVTEVGRISNQDFGKLIVAAESQRTSLLALALRMALGTAMRRGELLKLQWSDRAPLRGVTEVGPPRISGSAGLVSVRGLPAS